MAQRDFAKSLYKFLNNPKLQNTYAKPIYDAFQYIPNHPQQQSDRTLILKMNITKPFINMNGVIHGGALSTIVDAATTLAILKVDPKETVNVSIDLGVSFLNAARLDDELLIKAECQKLGKRVAYTTCEIFIENTMLQIVQGRHVKAILNKSIFDSE